MIRTLLVDDEPHARERLRRLLAEHADVELVGEAGDGVQALAAIERLRPDLVLLDIQMPELDGLAVAAALPREPSPPAIVFATAHDAHALRAFELAAVDYLLKPIRKERLAASLERVRRGAESGPGPGDLARAVLARLPQPSRRMAVRSGAKYVVFDTSRIAAVLAQDHYAAILVDGREHLSDDSLDKVMERLDPASFVRVHRSAIVNLEFVQELHQEGDRKYVAVLADDPGTRVPIARDRLDDLRQRLGIA